MYLRSGAFIQLKPSRMRDYLRELTEEDIIVAEGENGPDIPAEAIIN